MRTLPDRSLSVVARISAAATSTTPVEDRTEEILDLLQRVFPYDAAMVVSLRAPGGARRPVAGRGYPPQFADFLTTPQWHQEVVEPYALPTGGWPIRESDLPVDPDSIAALATYGRDAGLLEGVLSALIMPDGGFVGFVILSWSRAETPPDEAVEVIGSIGPTLANILDPLYSSRALVAALDDRSVALAFQPDGGVVTLRGSPPDELIIDAERRHHRLVPVATLQWRLVRLPRASLPRRHRCPARPRAREHLRAHPARAGGPHLLGQRRLECGDRQAAVGHHPHRSRPRRAHPGEARGDEPVGGRGPGHLRGPARSRRGVAAAWPPEIGRCANWQRPAREMK
jgi:hypothetical protein